MATAEQVRELVEKMHEERARLFAALKGIDEERASQPNPEKSGEEGWSVKEMLAHLAWMDITYRGWVTRAVTEDRPDVSRGVPGQAPSEGHYLDGVNQKPMVDLIRNLERVRAETMQFIASLSLDDFERTARTEIFGELTAMQWLRSYYRHDRQHGAQILGRKSATLLAAPVIELTTQPLEQDLMPISEWYRRAVRVTAKTEAGADIDVSAGNTGDSGSTLDIELKFPATTGLCSAIANAYYQALVRLGQQSDEEIVEPDSGPLRLFGLASRDDRTYRVTRSMSKLMQLRQQVQLVEEAS